MEYQKVINSLYNTLNNPCKLRIRNWVKINNVSHEMYSTNSQIKFQTSVIRSRLCDFGEA